MNWDSSWAPITDQLGSDQRRGLNLLSREDEGRGGLEVTQDPAPNCIPHRSQDSS